MALFYGIHDQWTDINKENDILVQSSDGVIDSIKVNGEEYGGGSSEFSTAVMTITTSDGDGSIFYALPHITENGISNENILLSSSQPVDIIIPLYNGKLTIYDDFNPSFTSMAGDITISGSNYVITGNCTVNYEPA